MIREYEKTDWPELEPLYLIAIEEWKVKSGVSRDIWDSVYTPLGCDDVDCGVVFERNGKIQGFIIGYKYDDSTFYGESVYFDPKYRGSAIPGRLYALFNQVLQRLGCKWVMAKTSVGHKEMDNLFKRLGFIPGDVTYYKRCEYGTETT